MSENQEEIQHLTPVLRRKQPMTKQEYNKRYYEKHKEVRVQKANEKVICDKCSQEVMRSNLSKHQKTAKCNKDYQLATTTAPEWSTT